MLYIFAIIIASIHVHDFPLDLSSVVLLKLIICFLSQMFQHFKLMWTIVKTTWVFQTNVSLKWVNL